MGVDDLVNVLEGSYGKNQVVFFASEYSELTLATKPSDWGYFDVYKYDESTGYQLVTAEEEWTFGTVYYVKNNFEIIPGITKEKDGVVYNLLGKYEDGIFTNEIISNGANHYAKIYPAIINTKYLTEEGRLQTAKEYIQEFMRGATAKGTTTDGYSLTYDVNLTKNSTVYTNKGNDSYLMVSGAYNPNRTYYIYEGSEWKPAIITQEIIDAWNPEDRKYHESVHCKNIKEVYASYDEFVADSRNLLYGTKWDDVVVTISKDDVKATIYNQDGFNLFGASHYVIFDSYAIDSVVSNEESVHMKVYP